MAYVAARFYSDPKLESTTHVTNRSSHQVHLRKHVHSNDDHYASSMPFHFSNIRIYNQSRLQTRREIGVPGDELEQEADHFARSIMTSKKTQLKSPKTQEHTLHPSHQDTRINNLETTASQAVSETLLSSGTSLDQEILDFMEPLYGFDFSRVRIHTDTKAAQSAHDVNALAYTVAPDIVFGGGQYRPRTRTGMELIAHELAHVIQQRDSSCISKENGAQILQRQKAGEEKNSEEEKKEAGEVIAEGLGTVAEQAKDNNPEVKKGIIDPLEKSLKSKWETLSAGEKAIGVGFGVATIGLTAGSLLADPNGRKFLEGIDLATPLKLVPYVPLTGFKYTLPTGETEEKRRFKFETTFSGNDYLKLLTERKNLLDMSLEVKMQWGYDPDTSKLNVLGAQAQIGLIPGLALSGGTYTGLLPQPQSFITPEGSTVTSKVKIPDVHTPSQSVHDVRIMLSVDLLKLDKSVIGNKLYNFLEQF